MYEFVGKLRNVSVNGPYTYLPYLAVEFAHYGAMLVGLHNQKLFSTGSMVLPEALELPSRPEGFDNVVRMVMSGELADPSRIISACENFWNGLVQFPLCENPPYSQAVQLNNKKIRQTAAGEPGV